MLPHLDAAYNLARWLAGNGPDADDIVQEAFLRAFRFFGGFQGGDGKPWLLAIVRNTCLTWRRREQAVAKVAFDEQTHGFVPPASPEALPCREELRECLQSLPVEFREVLVMRELEEMSYKDIAAVTGLPIGTVMSRLSRARRRLQECVTR